jgi:alkylation response protein AidB-like acyl-CoA dehydrogenase
MCCPGAEDAITSGVSIGLGPVMLFGSESTRQQVVQPCLEGKKVICLAITEPFAGSDVAGVTTTATLSEDGQYYTVTGTKKWITNAVFADYFTTLVRTSDAKGARGLSMLLIEKSDAVVVRPIPTEYSPAAGTGLISFENARVPVGNLLGKPGQGMMITMHNFNMERLGICTMSLGRGRRIIEETMLWAHQRKAFGKTLLQQPVIRQHIGKMISEHQSCYAYYQLLTFKYNNIPVHQRGTLGGETALLKYRTTRAMTLVSDLAVQVFGGRGVTKTGPGKHVSRMQKSFKFASVYGGSEEIMLDLGVRQAMKNFPINARL